MQNRKTLAPLLFMLLIGLLLTSTAPAAGRHFRLSDAALGAMIGAGIGLELLAVVMLIRRRNALKRGR